VCGSNFRVDGKLGLRLLAHRPVEDDVENRVGRVCAGVVKKRRCLASTSPCLDSGSAGALDDAALLIGECDSVRVTHGRRTLWGLGPTREQAMSDPPGGIEGSAPP